MVELERVGDFSLGWGESLRWDDRRSRLYFVDCAGRALHWLDGGEPPLSTMQLDGLPTGLVLTEGPELVVCLDDGLHVVDPDNQTSTLLAPYPEGMYGRANDANADGFGNLVTGTLNLAAAPGAYWWYSPAGEWRMLDEGIANANGPVVVDVEGETTLVFADTIGEVIYAYPYDGNAGVVGERRVFADSGLLGGAPDGATADRAGGVWSCVLNAGRLVRLTASGVDQVIELPVPYPSDVAFGGDGQDRLFFTSIAFDLGHGQPPEQSAWLCSLREVGHVGRPEFRFRLH